MAVIESGAPWLLGSATDWSMRALVDVEDALFHARMEEQLRNARSQPFQTLRFWHQSEEERSLEVFGCSLKIFERVLAMLSLALIVEMGPGGTLCHCEYAFWRPWGTDERVLEGWASERHCKEPDVPARLREWQEKICAASGCRLRASCGDETHGCSIAWEWVNNFYLSAERPTTHVTLEAANQLSEQLRELLK